MIFWQDYKKRFYLLIGIIPLILIICWNLALKETHNKYLSYQFQKKSYENFQNPDSTIAILKNKLNTFSHQSFSDPSLVDEYLIEFVSKNTGTYKIELEQFPKSHMFASSNYSIYTYELSLSGSYKNLLQFQNQLSEELGFGKIVSLNYHLLEKRNQNDKLILQIIYQVYFNQKQIQ